jgi:lysophospholipase L1-like esterase
MSKKFCAALIMLVVLGCRDPARLIPLSPGATVLCFGDSLTFGTGAEPGKSYPDELARLINRQVINAGIPGETSGEALARLAGELDHSRPKLLILCTGANDILRRMDLGQAAANVREMVKLARERKIDVVLIAVPQWGLGLTPAPFYREVGKELSVPVEERVLAKVLQRTDLKADQVHPNAGGYRKIAEAVAAMIAKQGGM